MNPPLVIEGCKFWKLIEGGINIFLYKYGVAHTGGYLYKAGTHCFSLVMYGLISSNALYSASLSFRMLIIVLN